MVITRGMDYPLLGSLKPRPVKLKAALNAVGNLVGVRFSWRAKRAGRWSVGHPFLHADRHAALLLLLSLSLHSLYSLPPYSILYCTTPPVTTVIINKAGWQRTFILT